MTLSEHHIANFKQNYLPRLREKYKVLHLGAKVIIITDEFGRIEYCPGKNEATFTNGHYLIKPALKWIISRLLKK